jgi:hypothetical protein
MNKTLERIAHEILDLDTLATRNSDCLDFHDVAVWNIKAALEAAYAAGEAASRNKAERAQPQKQPARSSDPN